MHWYNAQDNILNISYLPIFVVGSALFSSFSNSFSRAASVLFRTIMLCAIFAVSPARACNVGNDYQALKFHVLTFNKINIIPAQFIEMIVEREKNKTLYNVLFLQILSKISHMQETHTKFNNT